MIPLLVAAPLLFAFMLSVLPALGMEKHSKYLFLIGAISSWTFAPFILSGLPYAEIVGGWERPAGIEIAIDSYNLPFLVGELILFTIVAFYIYSGYYPKKIENKVYVLLLLLHAGLLGAFISRDIFNFYVYMEIASVSSFALVAISKEKGARRAAFKYALFSLLASYIFILAIGIIYLKTGYLNLVLIKERFTFSEEINVALGLAFISLLLKSGIFPLHFWLPDAHSKADAPVSALLSGLVVKMPAYGMILLILTFPLDTFMQDVLFITAFATMFFGIILALLQKNSERLLAYHTVSQMGYVLLGIAMLNPLAAAYYAMAHSLFKGGLFLSVGTIAEHYNTRDLEKLSYRDSRFLMVSVILLSLAIGGISPFIGAFGKIMLLEGLKDIQRYLFYGGTIGTLASFIKLNYYLSKRGKRIHIPIKKEMLSLLLGLISLIFGIYLYPHLQVVKDLLNIVIALILFYGLKKAGVFRLHLPSVSPFDTSEFGKEINAYMMIFGVVLLFLLFNLL
ncbi:monovalent cation/H+ antiporter subunit D family protein [Thermococcus sp. MV5]|uniref:monovalent cation/H+ antiporter subunit D family protein n=1 Tax=Thermococcus sp. MV5 TaxID=1638272 RepID=UPI00143B1181|nr:monovalent cation/H+ antiporter subunit D family protein [Thermococcus sp. MV5]NJE25535.1 monovalent cation/H+ antiporter subunit D family protein [Thermococcus sp. MV5]